jgi:hypothetical protein
MRKSLKVVLVLFIFTVVFAAIPALQSKAWAEEFVNKTPHFTVEVPKWNDTKKNLSPGTVLKRAEDMLELTTLVIMVEDLPANLTVKDLTPAFIADVERSYSAKLAEVKYEREIKLKDGTKAYEFEVQWDHPSIRLYTYEVVVFKDKKIVRVMITTGDPINDEYKKIPLSLSFK